MENGSFYMKNLLIFLFYFSVICTATAQDSARIQRKQAVYLEVGGTGQGLSLSYDRIFSQKHTWKLGARLGVGAIAFTELRPTVLGELFALRGKKGKFLEIGIGASYLFPVRLEYKVASTSVDFMGADQLWLVPRIGYRRQNGIRGNIFRVGLTPPIIFQGGKASIRLLFGLIFGQTF